MPAKQCQRGGGGASPAMLAFDLDTMLQQLNDYSEEEDGLNHMINLLNESKKAKLNPDDKSVINLVSILVPFVVASKTQNETVKKIQVNVKKNSVNIRNLAYHHEKLEQYTRRDNIRLFNFPTCDDGEIQEKFIELGAALGVTIQDSVINAIHKLPSHGPARPTMAVIVRLNSRKVRNDILYAKKTPLNAPESPFRGVFVQEDLTQPRSKLLRFIKNHENTDRARTSEGRIRVSLKNDRGAGKSVIVENPDHLFKIGLDSVAVTQFGYPDM